MVLSEMFMISLQSTGPFPALTVLWLGFSWNLTAGGRSDCKPLKIQRFNFKRTTREPLRVAVLPRPTCQRRVGTIWHCFVYLADHV